MMWLTLCRMVAPNPPRTERSWTQVLLSLTPLIIAVSVYTDTLFFDFVWDDFYLILEDHTIKSFKYLGVIFSSDFFGHQEDDLSYGYFRPVISLTYAIDYALWQKNPSGYHLTNILLHGLSSLLVAWALLKMKLPTWTAYAAALLFAVHPMHTENVAWIAGRTDIVAFALAMSAFIGHLSDRSGPKGFAVKGFTLLSFAAALLSKEMAVVVIPWIFFAEIAINRRRWRRAALSLLPYLGIVALYLVWRFLVVDVSAPVRSSDATAIEIIASAPWTVARYLAWLILPVYQTAYVQNPPVDGFGDLRLYGGVAIVAVLVYLFYRLRRSHPQAVGFSAMLGVSFIPILNFVAISGPGDMGNVMAERFLYFPSFPFFVIAALAADRLRRKFEGQKNSRFAVSLGLVIIISALAAATLCRNRVWKDNETFYRATLESSPSALILCNLANHYIQSARWDEAKKTLDKAKKYFKKDYHYLSAMALWHVAQRQYSQAIPLQKRVAKEVKRGRAVAYNNLAFLYRATGDYARAEALLNEIIYNKRGYADVYFNLAEVHRATGALNKAVKNYRKALDRRPDNIQMATALASALIQGDRLEEAAEVFETQLVMHRDNPGLLNNLGVVYKKMDRLDRARDLFERALRSDISYVKARLNLADALLASNQRRLGMAHLERIVQKHGDTPEADTARRLLDELKRLKPKTPTETTAPGGIRRAR